MRLAVALTTITQSVLTLIGSHTQVLSWATGSLEGLVGMALLFGFLTPIAGAFALLYNLAICISCFLASGDNALGKAIPFIYLAVISLAIVLLGPGAFSIDARLFGRREIVIPEASRPLL
jgi:uncharacterized membrane protein YphA (DoxX/SURF4 family)